MHQHTGSVKKLGAAWPWCERVYRLWSDSRSNPLTPNFSPGGEDRTRRVADLEAATTPCGPRVGPGSRHRTWKTASHRAELEPPPECLTWALTGQQAAGAGWWRSQEFNLSHSRAGWDRSAMNNYTMQPPAREREANSRPSLTVASAVWESISGSKKRA